MNAHFAAISVALAASVAFAGPPGDECGDAVPIGDGSIFDATFLTGYTGSTGDDTSCGTNDTIDRWFSYVASCTGTATATLDCSDFFATDATIAVFDSCGGAELACSENNNECMEPAFEELSARVNWGAFAGATYLIRVSAENYSGGGGGAFGSSLTVGCAGGPCPDTTPPQVEITSPLFDACFCGDDVIPVVGSVDDPDGAYECDTLAYRPVNADTDQPWVNVSTACGAFTGTLHSWDTTGIPGGRYFLRVTGSNDCDLTQSDVTVVRIDRANPTATIVSPGPGKSICGEYEVEGVACDNCGVDSWTLEYAPTGGSFTTLATSSAGLCCPGVLAIWDTTTVANGNYVLRLTVEDTCGLISITTRSVIVDNTGFCVCTPDLDGDGVVGFSDLLIVLSTWGKSFP